MFVHLPDSIRNVLDVWQARPEIIIKGALEYNGENTAWREYEVSAGCRALGPDRAQTRVRPRVLQSGSRSDWPYVELPWRSSVPSRAAEHAVCLMCSSFGASLLSVSLSFQKRGHSRSTFCRQN